MIGRAARDNRGIAVCGLLLMAPAAFAQRPGVAQSAAPVVETTFAATVARLSEPSGVFDTDNLISNESSYLHVVPRLRALGVRGGAYIGVGPDQNYSYIAQIKPKLALMVDIRRDAMMRPWHCA